MSVDALLERLHGVRSTGRGRWIARCPAHEDRRASLSIRELDDGRILVHCFALCALEQVLSSVNLKIEALFPDRVIDHRVLYERRPFPAADVLRAVAFEALVVAVAARAVARGERLAETDQARLLVAASRLEAAAHGQ